MAGQVGTGSVWKLHTCCAAATLVSGTRVAPGLHPGTPTGVKVFQMTTHCLPLPSGLQCIALSFVASCISAECAFRGCSLLHMRLCRACTAGSQASLHVQATPRPEIPSIDGDDLAAKLHKAGSSCTSCHPLIICHCACACVLISGTCFR